MSVYTDNFEGDLEILALDSLTHPDRKYRIGLGRDVYAGEPDGDAEPAVFSRHEYGYWEVRAQPTGGEKSTAGILQALQYFNELELFERWLRITGAGIAYSWSTRHSTYITVLTPEVWKDVWGNTKPFTEATLTESEWEAYCEGEVYGLERAHVVQEIDGEACIIDQSDLNVWGIYGEKYAREEAEAVLTAIRDEYDAKDMVLKPVVTTAYEPTWSEA